MIDNKARTSCLVWWWFWWVPPFDSVYMIRPKFLHRFPPRQLKSFPARLVLGCVESHVGFSQPRSYPARKLNRLNALNSLSLASKGDERARYSVPFNTFEQQSSGWLGYLALLHLLQLRFDVLSPSVRTSTLKAICQSIHRRLTITPGTTA